MSTNVVAKIDPVPEGRDEEGNKCSKFCVFSGTDYLIVEHLFQPNLHACIPADCFVPRI